MPVEARFIMLSNGIYGVAVDREVPSNAKLVIDPLPDRVWGTFFGGAGLEYIGGCVAYKNGNVFLYGSTNSPVNIATAGAHQTVYMGDTDAFLAKFDKDGLIQWATYYGGTGTEQSISASLDQFQNVYLSGSTESETNIATPNGFQPVKDFGTDAFLARFNPNGVMEWGTYYGGEGGDIGFECTIDLSGNVYLTGSSGSSNNIVTTGAYQETLNGLTDVFLVKFDGFCHRLWATYYGGEGFDEGRCCSADSLGHIFVAGRTFSTTGIASTGAHQPIYGGNKDGFLSCFSQHGQRIWGTYYGGEANDEIIDCASTLFGDVYITGVTFSLINISIAGAFQPSHGGGDDGFVSKFNQEGTILWGTYYGGTGGEWFISCAIDDSVNVYLAGTTTSWGLSTPGVYQPNLVNGSQDCILVKIDSAGVRKWATYYGGPGYDHGWCSVDTSWRVYLSGHSASPTMLSTAGSYQPLFGGGPSDSFLARFTQCMIPLAAGSIAGPDTVCKSASAVSFSVAPISGASGYSWQLPPGASITGGSNTNSILVSYGANAVSGNLTVHGTNYCGSGESGTLLVTVKDAPVPVLEGLDTICAGNQAVYSTSPGMFDYQWSISSGGTIVTGGSPTDSATTVIWNNPGIHWIEAGYTDSSGCAAFVPAHKTVVVSDLAMVGVQIYVSEDPVCEGQSVTCTAVPVNGGAFPQYQWKVNWLNVGSNSPTYTYIPANGDVVTVICTSSIVNCTLNNPATSTPVNITVNPKLQVNITIVPSSNPFCLGNPVTFTAMPVNGGSNPAFQWKVNGINGGTDNPVFTFSPVNGDVVTCSLSSSEICNSGNPAQSNPVAMAANANLPAGITIAASANPFCPGSTVTFTAIPINGGSNPVYQWKVNGINSGTNSSSFSYAPINNDSVRCVITSNLSCVTGNPTSSAKIIMVGSLAPNVAFSACFDTVTTVNAKPFKLKGGLPLGGSYSGPGVNSSTAIFTPSVAGIGVKTINYSYINVHDCSANKSKSIVVQPYPSFTCGSNLVDTRDNKVYLTVQIGTQCWMSKNLDFGLAIANTIHQADNCIAEKYCYNGTVANCSQYGGLYQWDELMKFDDNSSGQGLCPPGWHVPSETDWTTLMNYYQGNSRAGRPLQDSIINGFKALRSGVFYLNSSWSFLDFATILWSSTASGQSKAISHGMNLYNFSVSLYPASKANAFAVRCLRDQ